MIDDGRYTRLSERERLRMADINNDRPDLPYWDKPMVIPTLDRFGRQYLIDIRLVTGVYLMHDYGLYAMGEG